MVLLVKLKIVLIHTVYNVVLLIMFAINVLTIILFTMMLVELAKPVRMKVGVLKIVIIAML